MDPYLILGVVFGILGIVLVIALIIVAVCFSVWFIKSWNQGKRQRQENAEAHQMRHGGRAVLEWDGPRASGEPDGEFGPLLVVIPKNSGSGGAYFYQSGAVIGGTRVSYENLKDVVYLPGPEEPRKIRTAKQAVQDSAVLWLYRKKGTAIGIRDFQYQFDNQTMEAIQNGLGYKKQEP